MILIADPGYYSIVRMKIEMYVWQIRCDQTENHSSIARASLKDRIRLKSFDAISLNVPDRHDQHAETLQAATNPDAVLEAIEQRKEPRE
ncbi:hypothetical protein [Caballeronia sp. LZ001]|uniref:hypothetical protein n=1 Tax=Caballeronia sp. LZ001 TaxID=3038553 RepID=UPI0028616506|nr:hypothetical protein [Caballeronia sp. LZ001]MDR5806532.1 hypothetical protein [Caballeronia sp. LZ001]